MGWGPELKAKMLIHDGCSQHAHTPLPFPIELFLNMAYLIFFLVFNVRVQLLRKCIDSFFAVFDFISKLSKDWNVFFNGSLRKLLSFIYKSFLFIIEDFFFDLIRKLFLENLLLILEYFHHNFVYLRPEVGHNVVLPFFSHSFSVSRCSLFEFFRYFVQKLSVISDFFASFLQLLLKFLLNLNNLCYYLEVDFFTAVVCQLYLLVR